MALLQHFAKLVQSALPPDTERAILKALNQLVDAVNLLAQQPVVTTLKSGNYNAKVGENIRMRAGGSVNLPTSRPETAGKEVAIFLETEGTLRITSVGGRINGNTDDTVSGIGLQIYRSDGNGGWFSSSASSSGSTLATIETIEGAVGATGITGATGAKGSSGFQGPPGRWGQDGPRGIPGPPGQIGPAQFYSLTVGPATWTDQSLSALCPGIKSGDIVGIQLTGDLLIQSITPPAPGFWCRLGVNDQSGGNFALTIRDTVKVSGGSGLGDFRTPGSPFGDADPPDFVIRSEEGFTTIVRGVSDTVWRIIEPTNPAALVGIQGPPGRVGADGYRGIPGMAGQAGISGATGTAGAQGAPGRSGNDGSPGKPGIDGQPGVPGSQGATGTVGPPGREFYQGVSLPLPGPQGQLGATGATGGTGATGATGPTGAGTAGTQSPPWMPGVYFTQGVALPVPGASGAAGAAGVAGSAGAPGAAGATVPGRMGEMGLRGVPIPGSPGATGATGPAGVAGAILATATVSFGTTAQTSGTFDITGLSGLVVNTPIAVSLAVTTTDPTEAEQSCVIAGYAVSATAIRCFWNAIDRMQGSRIVQYLVPNTVTAGLPFTAIQTESGAGPFNNYSILSNTGTLALGASNTFTGFLRVGGNVDGDEFYVRCNNGIVGTLTFNDGASTSTNRISTASGLDLSIPSRGMAKLRYEAGNWRVVDFRPLSIQFSGTNVSATQTNIHTFVLNDGIHTRISGGATPPDSATLSIDFRKQFSRQVFWEEFEDFDTTAISPPTAGLHLVFGQSNWLVAGIAHACTVASAGASQVDHPGIVQLQSAGSNGDGALLLRGNVAAPPMASQVLAFEWVVAYGIINTNFQCGFSSDWSITNPVSFVGFQSTANDGVITARCTRASVTTTLASAIHAAGAFVRLRAEQVVIGTWEFFIAGTSIGTIATNVPDAVGVNLGAHCIATANAVVNMYADYAMWESQTLNR